jgi:predicted enzyme related to lactoylglutathione lyase
VLFVADVPHVADFYRGVFAMERIDGDADHEVLQLEGFQVVIHRLRGEPDPVKDADGKVIVREDSYMKLCLPVRSIDAARTRAQALGGVIKPAAHEWEARGFRACDGHDPEGNVIQARERAG